MRLPFTITRTKQRQILWPQIIAFRNITRHKNRPPMTLCGHGRAQACLKSYTERYSARMYPALPLYSTLINSPSASLRLRTWLPKGTLANASADVEGSLRNVTLSRQLTTVRVSASVSRRRR